MKIEEFVSITKALSDPHRVRAFMALRRGELCVCQIIELLSLAPSTVSKHMAILKSAGLVDSRKDSRWVYYRVAESADGEQIRELIAHTVALLESDKSIEKDDKCMNAIVSEGLEALCRKQRRS